MRIRRRVTLVIMFVAAGVTASAIAANKTVSAAEAVKRAKEAVTRDFNDPVSVQWKNVYLNRKPDGEYVVCGSLNAKNLYGAYTGFRYFYAIVDMHADAFEHAMADIKRMGKQAERNLDNVGKGLREESDVYIDPGDSRAFFEANQKMCVDGKRTYVK